MSRADELIEWLADRAGLNFPTTRAVWISAAKEVVAAVCEEGRREERARCAAVAREYAGDPSETYGSNDAAFDMSVKMGIALANSIAKAIALNVR